MIKEYTVKLESLLLFGYLYTSGFVATASFEP